MLSAGARAMVAKWGREKERPPDQYHPLACHLADVAAVALALWNHSLPPAARMLLTGGLGFEGNEAERKARLWVSFLAGLHDLGKASKPFQKRESYHQERLAGTGLDVECPRDDPGHGRVTAVALKQLLAGRGIEGRLAGRLALLVGGHHGLFPGKLPPDADFCEARDDAGQWPAVREELFNALADVVGVSGEPPSGELPNAAAMVFSGLVTVADWIGSIEGDGYFEYDPPGVFDLPAYFTNARRRADTVLRRLHWLSYPEPGNERSFRELFGWDPRPLQEATETLADRFAEGGIVVIEAPTGEGKTEAAFHLVDSWNAGKASRGCYIGLPTQATATQMYGRVVRFLGARFPGEEVNLVLAHGGAAAMDLEALPGAIFDDEDGPRGGRSYGRGSIAAGEWFLQRKRALLAPYGVGTVDQALMSVLQVRHVFVRLLGLAGKPVVIDEVHAYDTYMTGLLERLLEWLGALRSPVALLSATLPSERRRRLLAAYLRGSSADELAFSPSSEAAPYPRVTYLDGAVEASHGFAADHRSRRTLEIARAPDDPAALARYLNPLLSEGGCAAVICNTVARAQNTYRVMRDELGLEPGTEIRLFHARFMAKDRQSIEEDCTRRFGPPDRPGGTTNSRPPRFVLVATQVIEQSLDLDFDVMVSDIAPIDLLLQRSGRLLRHDRADRHGPAEPVLHVRWPEEDQAGVPEFDSGSRAVYDHHILLRTWHALTSRPAIRVPEGVPEVIDWVYTEGEGVPEDASHALQEEWHRTWKEMLNHQSAEREEAKARRLRPPYGEPATPARFLPDPREEDDPDLHPQLQAVTRLAAPSVRVIMLPADAEEPGNTPGLSRDRVRELLGHEISVSHRLALVALWTLEAPAAFAALPALRRHRLLQLDSEGTAQLESAVFTYSAELGLGISTAEQHP